MSQEENSNENHFQTKVFTYATIGIGCYVAYKTFFSTYTHVPSNEYHTPSDDEFPEYPRGEKYWATNPWEEVKIRYSKKGPSSWKPVTVMEVLESAINKSKDSLMLHQEKLNDKGEYEWISWTRQQYYDQIMQAARSFIALGLKPWESVAIIGFNSPEWFISDLGCIYAGGLAAGIYTTNNAGQCLYIIDHCKARIIVCENEIQLKKFISIQDKLTNINAIIMWDGIISSEIQETFNKNNKNKCKLFNWNEFIHYGNNDMKKLNDEIIQRKKNIKPGNCCTLIYTSGTTGAPKAVMISHDNITWDVRCIINSLEDCDWSKEHNIISYLPLSHIAAQVVDIHATLGIMHWKGGTGGIWFARADALKGSLNITLKKVRPTIFFGVPRVWEKIEEKMKEIGSQSNVMTKYISSYAKNIGSTWHKAIQIDGNLQIPVSYTLINKFLFSKIKHALGLDRCIYAVVGAAPVKKSTIEYFGSIGIPIVEVYGMSECTGGHSVGRNFYNKISSVGPPLYGVENVILHEKGRDKQGEGEICMRGRHVMMGYMYDVEKTKSAIDDEGLLHSGDVGKQDDKDFIYITGRIKELIITAGGENIAPVPIEDYIKTEAPAISNIVLIGDQKKYLTCLITLKCVQNFDTNEFENNLTGTALKVNPNVKTVDEARNDPIWKQYIENVINKYNKDKDACVSNAQMIQYYKILDGDFSIPGGELTSTLKLKRNVIVDKYAKIIDAMYK